MCILSYIPAGVEPDIDHLRNGGESNPHGHGWAVIADGEILVGKSLDLEVALAEFAAVRKVHKGDAMFHSRWATHGSINTDNCHPFQVGRSPLTVVGHNGILPNNAHPKKGDDRSDTRLFADEILCTRYRRLDKPRAFDALSGYCGKFNKLVILTIDPRYRHNAYVVNEDMGTWDLGTGVWHSNGDYKFPAYPPGGHTRKWWEEQDDAAVGNSCGYKSARESAAVFEGDGDLCYVCESGVIDTLGYCVECGICEDCLEHSSLCQCWRRYESSRRTDNTDEIAEDYTLSLMRDDDYSDYLDESPGVLAARIRRIYQEG